MLGADDVADGMADTILNGVMVGTTERQAARQRRAER
jgi:hypothetical protein